MKVVLFNPCIPQNTGNIGRLLVSNNISLHLIAPLGFSLEDRYLKRSGLDYWQHLIFSLYENWEDFLKKNPNAQMKFFSKKSKKSIFQALFSPEDFLIFGSEIAGLPNSFHNLYSSKIYKIPMYGTYQRSLNLANSVAIVLYEGLRQNYEANS